MGALADQPNQAKALFLEATERHSPDEWPAFLDRVCAEDAALRGAVERLLQARVELGSFHEAPRPPLGAAAGVLVAEPPARLGDYRIHREVGRGGMGVVYEAIQESLGRHVALKVLPARAGHRGNALERFKREARAAANLHHTNIVPVFGVGEADGVHYYAMQFIAGQGLDAVLDELRRLRDKTPSVAGDSQTTVCLAANLASGRFPAAVVEPVAPADQMAATRNGSARSDSTVLSGSSELASGPDAAYFRTVARLGAQVADALAYAHA
jgi:eukaryotic-like serine/threonine-protein kinase